MAKRYHSSVFPEEVKVTKVEDVYTPMPLQYNDTNEAVNAQIKSDSNNFRKGSKPAKV